MIIKSTIEGTPDELEYSIRMLMDMLSKHSNHEDLR